jgi:hypothetical protein
LTDVENCALTINIRMSRFHRSRVAAIANKPGSHEIFGAGPEYGHRFKLAIHSPDEVRHFEKALGVSLPEEYSQILIEAGSGAGPYYGLLAPANILSEISSLLYDVTEGEKSPKPSDPFPLRKSDLDQTLTRHASGTYESHLSALWLSDGCIPICNQGCTALSALITAGEMRGTVWTVNDDGAVAQWWPGTRPPGLLPLEFSLRPLPAISVPPTFLEWYESWLERVETDLDDYKHRRPI